LLTIEINADMGESRERLADGSDAELMRYITSANIACGGMPATHSTMEETLELAKRTKSPRVPIQVIQTAPVRTECRQSDDGRIASVDHRSMNALQGIARRLNSKITHVKPHGALYHSCNEDEEVARAVARAILAVDAKLVVVGQADSDVSTSIGKWGYMRLQKLCRPKV
jgi:UPF0271 protein